MAEQGVAAWALPSAPRHYWDRQGNRRRHGFGRGGDGKTSGAPPSAQVNPLEIAPGYEAHPWGPFWMVTEESTALQIVLAAWLDYRAERPINHQMVDYLKDVFFALLYIIAVSAEDLSRIHISEPTRPY